MEDREVLEGVALAKKRDEEEGVNPVEVTQEIREIMQKEVLEKLKKTWSRKNHDI